MTFTFEEIRGGKILTACIPEKGETVLDIPEGVIYIKPGALRKCTRIEQVFLPASVRIEDDNVFSSMTALQRIIVHPSHPYLRSHHGVLLARKNIGVHLVCYPAGRPDETYEVPRSVSIIRSHAFSNAVHLQSIVVHEGVFEIDEGAFSSCHALRFADLRCEHLDHLSSGAFRFCSALERVSINGLIEHVGYLAFDGCLKLRHIEFPNGLISLDKAVFCRCAALESVYLPASVTFIGADAFYECDKLSRISCAKGTAKLIPAHHDVISLLPL